MPADWTNRVWLEFRAGNLTRTFRDVLLSLHTFRGTGGHCWPSHATLADRAGCCVKTVQRALHQAQQLGVVEWTERRVRAGWRWLRTSNAYRFTSPATAVRPGWRPTRGTTGHSGRGGESESKKSLLREMMAAAASLPDLLARRRRMFEPVRNTP